MAEYKAVNAEQEIISLTVARFSLSYQDKLKRVKRIISLLQTDDPFYISNMKNHSFRCFYLITTKNIHKQNRKGKTIWSHYLKKIRSYSQINSFFRPLEQKQISLEMNFRSTQLKLLICHPFLLIDRSSHFQRILRTSK